MALAIAAAFDYESAALFNASFLFIIPISGAEILARPSAAAECSYSKYRECLACLYIVLTDSL